MNVLSGGMSSSFVIACKRRGAEVSDCKAAPIVDNNAPITIKNGYGHAIKVTANWPLAHSPNLSLMNRLSNAAPNKTTELKYTNEVVS